MILSFISCIIKEQKRFLLISQSSPAKPGGQAHVYEPMPSVQVPPLLQGLPLHSLISENITKYDYFRVH